MTLYVQDDQTLVLLAPRDEELHERLSELRGKTAVPVFWLFGKTQSGKTSIIKYLTGAEDAEIGRLQAVHALLARVRLSRRGSPAHRVLDTRGLDEPVTTGGRPGSLP